MTLENIKKDINNIRKKTIYNYKYEYWMGNEKNLTNDNHKNKIYGEDRKGYEQFKNDFKGDIGYGGYISFRGLEKDGELVGCILERKISNNPHVDAAKGLYDQALQETIDILDVKDKISFDYYVREHILEMGYSNSVDNYSRAVERLIELVENFNEDPEFKTYINKIIG